MSTYVVVGLQYGDEGKGKITDVLSAKSDYVVRFRGGDNAGHTVYVGDEKFVLHLLPSGVLQCKGNVSLQNGVVVNPKSFIKEVGQIESKGFENRSHLYQQKSACHHAFTTSFWILIVKRNTEELRSELPKRNRTLL